MWRAVVGVVLIAACKTSSPVAAPDSDGPSTCPQPMLVQQGGEYVESAELLALGDLDGDGDLDIEARSVGMVHYTMRRTQLINDGAGRFTEVPIQREAPMQCFGQQGVVFGDVTGDGIDDFACAKAGPLPGFGVALEASLSTQSGLFAAIVDEAVSSLVRWPTANGPQLVYADGTSDLKIASYTYGSTMLTATPMSAPHPVSALAVGDLDGDGVPELVAGGAQQLTVFDGATRMPRTFPGAPGQLAVADVDGDTRGDVVAVDSSEIAVSISRGGELTAPTFTEIPFSRDAVWRSIVADFDGDRVADVLYVSLSSSTTLPVAYLVRGRGNGTFHPAELMGATGSITSSRVGLNAVAAGDFDGDGIPELALSAFGPLSIWKATCAPP